MKNICTEFHAFMTKCTIVPIYATYLLDYREFLGGSHLFSTNYQVGPASRYKGMGVKGFIGNCLLTDGPLISTHRH